MTKVPMGLAVFDLDGTLIDSQQGIVAPMRAAFEDLDLDPPDPSAIRSVIGLPLDTAIQKINPYVRGLLTERLVESYKDHAYAMQTHVGPDPLIPGALSALDRLAEAGVLLAIATGKGRLGLVNVLEAHGITGRFVSLQCADNAPGKPDPTMLLQAMDEADVGQSATAMIGDTTFDLEMAHNAGVAGIGVTWGYHDIALLLSIQPDAVIHHFDELDGALNEKFGLSMGSTI
ncbi:MAG: hypothetical protein CMM47_03835 [Rhodospirillaceae bacterium]|nr:hypothetical protein [Rhodospirillaceae bacterium]